MSTSSSSPRISGYLLMEILVRLPIKSLVRFQCVCKYWNSLIQDPHFISFHSLRNSNNLHYSLLTKRLCKSTKTNVLCVLSNNTTKDGDTKDGDFVATDIIIPPELCFKNLRIVGCCNGLVCLSHDGVASFGSPTFLWNPATRKFRALPNNVILSPSFRDETICGVVHGFGYDAGINDYKVLRIVFFDTPDRTNFRAELFSFSSDLWREIESEACALNCRVYDPQCTFVNGAFYCIAHGDGVIDILSFDMVREVFRKIDLYALGDVVNSDCLKLCVCEGSLCLIAYTFRGRNKWFNGWLMNERGRRVWWTKQFSFGPLFGVERPLNYGMNGEIFMERMGKLVLYNSSNDELRVLLEDGTPYAFDVHYYGESLVSVNR